MCRHFHKMIALLKLDGWQMTFEFNNLANNLELSSTTDIFCAYIVRCLSFYCTDIVAVEYIFLLSVSSSTGTQLSLLCEYLTNFSIMLELKSLVSLKMQLIFPLSSTKTWNIIAKNKSARMLVHGTT